jgi:hypothetical protein
MNIGANTYMLGDIDKTNVLYDNNAILNDFLTPFTPILLNEIDNVKLMKRTDTKFITKFDKLCNLLSLMQNDYYLLKINDNFINPYKTLYLDTPKAKMFTDHHNGHNNRKKVRFRTYLNSNSHFLEIKHKSNKGVTKKIRISVPDYNYYDNNDAIDFLTNNTAFTIEELTPHLESIYERITLINKEKTERLTIDLNLKFKNHRTGTKGSLEKLVIVELKQDLAERSLAREFLYNLHIKPTKLSKYCIGSVMTNPNIKHNRFKPKLIKINKIINLQ